MDIFPGKTSSWSAKIFSVPPNSAPGFRHWMVGFQVFPSRNKETMFQRCYTWLPFLQSLFSDLPPLSWLREPPLCDASRQCQEAKQLRPVSYRRQTTNFKSRRRRRLTNSLQRIHNIGLLTKQKQFSIVRQIINCQKLFICLILSCLPTFPNLEYLQHIDETDQTRWRKPDWVYSGDSKQAYYYIK